MVATFEKTIEKNYWDLPEGWQWIQLSQLCESIVGGGTPDRKNPDYWGGDIYWASVKDLKSDEILATQESITAEGLENSAAKLVEPGTVVVATRMGLGKVSIAKTRVAINQDLKGLILSSGVLAKYLTLYLKSRASEIEHQGSGVTVKGIKLNELKAWLIPIPYPESITKSLDIQHRIVARIEALLAEVRESRNLIQKMRQDAERLMGTALSEVIEKLDEQYPNSPTISELISSKKIQIEGGGTPSRSNENYWNGLIPWISPKDMKRWYIKDAQEHISHDALQETAVKLIPEGSVLIVVRGMILAHTLPVGINQNEVTINQDMKALVPSNNLLPDYLGYILRTRSPLILQQVETAAHGTKRLKTDTLMQVIVPTPHSYEQVRVIEYLNFIQHEVDEIQKLLDKDAQLLDMLEQSILERAFRGEL